MRACFTKKLRRRVFFYKEIKKMGKFELWLWLCCLIAITGLGSTRCPTDLSDSCICNADGDELTCFVKGCDTGSLGLSTDVEILKVYML